MANHSLVLLQTKWLAGLLKVLRLQQTKIPWKILCPGPLVTFNVLFTGCGLKTG